MSNPVHGGLWSQALQKAIGKKHPTTGQLPAGAAIPPAPFGAVLGGARGPNPRSSQSGVSAQQSPANEAPRRKSDDRFRSFAERYVLTRSHLWPEDPDEWQKAMYAAILDARVAYNTIKKVGFNAEFDSQ